MSKCSRCSLSAWYAPNLNAAREQKILAEVEAKSGDLAPYSRELFRVLMDLSKDRQRELFGRMAEAGKEE